MSDNDRYYLSERLKHGGVQLYKNVHADSFLSDGIRFRAGDHVIELRGIESVVLADTFVSLREAANLLKPYRVRIHFIGDVSAHAGVDRRTCMGAPELLPKRSGGYLR